MFWRDSSASVAFPTPHSYLLTPPKAMNDVLLKTCAELRAIGADGAVIGSVENVTYVTNVEQPLPYGALASTTVAPWLAIVSAKEERGIVLAPEGKVAELEATLRASKQSGFLPSTASLRPMRARVIPKD